MFNWISKLLPALFDPFFVALLLAIASLLLWKKRRLAWGLLLASVGILLVLSAPPVSLALARSLEGQFPDVDVAQVAPAQALVVLGGTIRMPSGQHHASGITEPSDRLLKCFRLYRAGKAPLIVCSGGNNPVGKIAGVPPEAEGMEQLLEEWGVPQSAIEVENGSINTHENALLSYRLLAPRGITRIILVTSALHMPRAAAAFRKVGFAVTPAPADFHTGWGTPPAFERWIPSVNSIRESERDLREWSGIWVYRWRGWA